MNETNLPKNLSYKWISGFDFPEEVKEKIKILVEATLFENAELMREYFFWGAWQDTEETIPAKTAVEIMVKPYDGVILIKYMNEFEFSSYGENNDRFYGRVFSVEQFPTQEDENKKLNEARFEVYYDGPQSTHKERSTHKKVVLLPTIVYRRTSSIDVISER